MGDWYRHDIPAWMDGTEGLGDGAYRAYHVICQLIYTNEGPVVLNERGIAGRCNQQVHRFRKNLKELIDAGKVHLDGGRIFNERCDRELSSVLKNRENASKGGKSPRTSRSHRDGRDKASVSDHDAHRNDYDEAVNDHDALVSDQETSVNDHEAISAASKLLRNNETPSSVALTELKPIRRDETRQDDINTPSGSNEPSGAADAARDEDQSEPESTPPAAIQDEAEPSELDDTWPAEERFWDKARIARLEAVGVPRSRQAQLVKAMGDDFEGAIDVLDRASRMKQPSAYVGGVIRQRNHEALLERPPDPIMFSHPADPSSVPPWVIERRELGARILPLRKGRWEWDGRTYDDSGDQLDG
ncbi:MAG: YdaU family protein [Chelatococcus sp.]|uniref:DUF1376 domain-containing protein n=1 Tax=Chelatococcus sp. TaxID=1953771 RepID=UPI0025B8FD9A|nr:DUF1376 domain-containing protein [Chelatococcus sp.]MBX3537319.1 YdaU family protein [Chelatococcus sp.]